MKYLSLILLLGCWCVVHSGMISLPVTSYMKKTMGAGFKYYRLIFNAFAILTFFPILLYSKTLKEVLLFGWEGILSIIQLAFLGLSISLFICGAKKYDILHFLGLRQIKSGTTHATLSASGDLDTSGILNITRHPWYLAAIIFVWVNSRNMYLSSVIVNSILTVYLIAGTYLEERKLIVELGESYRRYMDNVSMLFPTKWLVSKVKALLR